MYAIWTTMTTEVQEKKKSFFFKKVQTTPGTTIELFLMSISEIPCNASLL